MCVLLLFLMSIGSSRIFDPFHFMLLFMGCFPLCLSLFVLKSICREKLGENDLTKVNNTGLSSVVTFH